MSGLVSTTLAFLRAHARSSVVVSPSNVTALRPGTSHERIERSWSWASALVGKMQQRGVAAVGDDRFDDRKLVAERLSRSSSGRDHDARSCAELVDGLGLMGEELLDAAGPIRSVTSLGERFEHVCVLRRARRQHFAVHEPADELRVGRERVERIARVHRSRVPIADTDTRRRLALLAFGPGQVVLSRPHSAPGAFALVSQADVRLDRTQGV